MGLTVHGKPVFMKQRVKQDNDIRLILVHGLPNSDAIYVLYLYWDDASDLATLDRKVQEGTYSDEDFRNAIGSIGDSRSYE